MAESFITDKGKTEVLRLAFKNDDARGAFNYMALGGANSSGAEGGEFVEVSGSSYHRVKTDIEESPTTKMITISGTFDETNFNVSGNGELIKEIGLVNSSEDASEQTFFAYCEVPQINKNDSITLKYTIVIEIE